MIPVTVKHLVVNSENNGFVCLLADEQTDRYLPIGVGSYEAQAIALKLGPKQEVPRPLTHDLLASTIEQVGSSVDHVTIDDLHENVFHAHVSLLNEGDGPGKNVVDVEARPSDAIALALRTGSSIFVTEDVMDQGGVEAAMVEEREETGSRLEELREQLEEAVEAEDYEKAARLRDEIQEVQSEIRRRDESIEGLDEELEEQLTRAFEESGEDPDGGGSGNDNDASAD